MRANKKRNINNHIIFPVIETARDKNEREVLSIFLSKYRDISVSSHSAHVMKAIEKTSHLTGYGGGLVAKILVDNGLRAERESFPYEFLDHIDRFCFFESGKPSLSRTKEACQSLKKFWKKKETMSFAPVGRFLKDRSDYSAFLT